MNEPVDHHYLPQFYLNKWGNSDGKVLRYSQPTDTFFEAKPVAPKGTAFEPHLYSVSGAPSGEQALMETKFFARIDNGASQAIKLLEQGKPDHLWTPRERSCWTRYLWSQMLRVPEEIAQLKSSVKDAWRATFPDLQTRYENQRAPSDPNNVDDYLGALDSIEGDEFAFDIARTLMVHSGIEQIINNMQWGVLDYSECSVLLLTSDRPIWMTPTLLEEDAFITMPIGPAKLFVAAKSQSTLYRLQALPKRQQAKYRNKLSVQHAVKFVFADERSATGTQQAFVEKHFSTKRHSTIMERLAVMQGHRIVDPSSPANQLI